MNTTTLDLDDEILAIYLKKHLDGFCGRRNLKKFQVRQSQPT